MKLEKMTLSLDEAQIIMKNYLEKIIDFVDGEIVRCTEGAYLMDRTEQHGKEVKRFSELKTKSYFDILRLALIEAGYPVAYVKETNYGGQIKYECFYELVSQRGR